MRTARGGRAYLLVHCLLDAHLSVKVVQRLQAATFEGLHRLMMEPVFPFDSVVGEPRQHAVGSFAANDSGLEPLLAIFLTLWLCWLLLWRLLLLRGGRET